MSTIIDLLKNSVTQKNTDYVGIPSIPLTRYERFSWLPTKKLLLIVIPLMLCIASMMIIIKRSNHLTISSNNQVQETHVQLNTIPNSISNYDKQIVHEGEITDISINQKKDYAELNIVFNQPILYRVSSHQKDNRYTLAFDNTQVKKEISIDNAHKAGIKDIKARILNDALTFDLLLNENTTLASITPNKSNNNYILNIKLIAQDSNALKHNEPPIPKIRIMQKSERHDDVYENYASALSDAQAGKIDSAIKKLDNLTLKNPTYINSQIALAALLLDQKQFEKSKRVIQQGLQIEPNNIALTELSARIYLHEGKPTKALRLLDNIHPNLSDNPSFYALKAAIYERENQHDLAITLYQQLLSYDYSNGQWWFGLALSFDKKGRFNDAVRAYEKALNNGHLPTESLAFLQTRLDDLKGYSDG